MRVPDREIRILPGIDVLLDQEVVMNAKIIVSTAAVAALVLGNGVMMHSQDVGSLAAQEDASAQSDARAQDDNLAEGDETRAVRFASLTRASRENVEVWKLTCTSTPVGFAQVARALIQDRGGADGRLLYFHLTRTRDGATVKRTAPDGGTSSLVAVGSGGAGSTFYIGVSKDRNGLVVLGTPIREDYALRAECFAGVTIRPHTLVLVQDR